MTASYWLHFLIKFALHVVDGSNVSVAFKATVSPASKCGGPASSHHKSKQGVKAAAKTSKQPPKVAAHIKRAYNTSITFLRNREVKVSRQALHAMIHVFTPNLHSTSVNVSA